MTPKERIQAILKRQSVDRFPVDLWHTPEVGAMLREHLGVATDLDAYRALGLDKIVWVFMGYRHDPDEEAAGSQVGAQAMGRRTMWGVPLQEVEAGEAHYQEVLEPPLCDYDTVESIHDYPYWPEPDRFDIDTAVELARSTSQEFATIGPWVSLFEIYCQLRGLEQAMIDVAVSPHYVDTVLDEIEWRQTEMMTRFFKRAADSLDLAFISDDMGSQHGLIMSPDMWQRHFPERLSRWCDLVHSFGLKVFYHTDGAAEPIIAPLIDCGIDLLNPVQHACPGMAMDHLKRTYGRDLIFHGGVDNQTVLPFGSEDDVKRETEACLDTLGADGEGYICCSCHNVQPGTPLKNILSMIETVKQTRHPA